MLDVVLQDIKFWRVEMILPVIGEKHPWIGKFYVAFYKKAAVLGRVEEVNADGDDVLYTLLLMERHGPDSAMYFTFAGESSDTQDEYAIVKHDCIFEHVHAPIRMPIEKYILPGAGHNCFIRYFDMFSHLK